MPKQIIKYNAHFSNAYPKQIIEYSVHFLTPAAAKANN